MTDHAVDHTEEMQYSPYLAHTLRRAITFARQRGHAYVDPDHLLFALLDDPEALALLEDCDTDLAALRQELGGMLGRGAAKGDEAHEPEPNEAFRQFMQIAATAARNAGRTQLDGAIIIAALASQTGTPAAKLLRRHGLHVGRAIAWLREAPAREQERRAQAALEPPAPRPVPPPPPSWAAGGERPPAPRPAPPPGPAREEPAPARQPRGRDSGGSSAPRTTESEESDLTLQEMLATVRDVILDEDAEGAAPPPPQRQPMRPSGPPPPPSSAHRPADPSAPRRRPEAPRAAAPPPGAGPIPPMAKSAPSRSAPAAPEPRHPAPPRAARSGPPARRRGAAQPPVVVPLQRRASGPTPLGRLVERIPRTMRDGVAEQVEIRIAKEASDRLLSGLAGKGAPQAHDVYVTRAMSVYLRAPKGGFLIEPLTPETQWVFDRPSFLDSEPFGQWRWTVLPMARGQRQLQLVVAARSVDEHGMIGDTPLPAQIIEVSVRINWPRTMRKAVFWAGLAAAGGVLTEMTLDFFRALLRV